MPKKKITEENIKQEAAEKTPGTKKDVPPIPDTSNTGTVTGGALNVRSTPEVGDNIIGVLEDRTAVAILEDAGKWLRIEYGDAEGYVMARYIAR